MDALVASENPTGYLVVFTLPETIAVCLPLKINGSDASNG